jgi:co-chaperonin GroES (HSP10)
MSYKLKAGKDRMIVKPVQEEEFSKSGLILSPEIKSVKEGIITAVDPDYAFSFFIGDKVMYHKQAFTEITINQIKYHVINIVDVLVILSEK